MEKSVSKSQQKLMCMAYALKTGEMDPADASDEVKELAKSMSEKDLKDFASTKHDKLPTKIAKESTQVDGRTKAFKQAMKRIESYKNKKKAEMEASEYEDFFRAALKKFGVKSPNELDGKKEKQFYDYVDANWKGKDESTTLEKVQKILNDKRMQRMNEVDEPSSKNEKDFVDLHRKNTKKVVED